MKRHLPDSINIPKALQGAKRRNWVQEFETILMETLQLRENQNLLIIFAHAFKENQMQFFTESLSYSHDFEVKATIAVVFMNLFSKTACFPCN